MPRLMTPALAAIVVCTAIVSALGQDATLPPSAQHAVLTVEGRGVQIYTCTKTPTAAEWIFVAPAARLFDKDGTEIGTHGDGPVWHLQDGSSVLGKVVAKSPSADPGSVPWLLVKTAAATGPGALAAIEYIRRSDTHGGVAPATGCDSDHLGDLARIQYTSTYTFYSAK